jgi:hypothetical protein
MQRWRLEIHSPIRVHNDLQYLYREKLITGFINDVPLPSVGTTIRVPTHQLLVQTGNTKREVHDCDSPISCTVRSLYLDLGTEVYIVPETAWHPAWARLVFGRCSRRDAHHQEILEYYLNRFFPNIEWDRMQMCDLHMRSDPQLYKELVRRLRDLIKKYLPPEFLKVVTAHWGVDSLRTHKAMGEVLGMSPSTAGKRLSQAYSLFHETMGFVLFEERLMEYRLVGPDKYDYYTERC